MLKLYIFLFAAPTYNNNFQHQQTPTIKEKIRKTNIYKADEEQ